MKAEELMIGDLVTFKDCQNDEAKTIIKIWGLNSDGDAFAFIDGFDTLDEINIDDEIVGIPLTPEILEKNGFKKGRYCYEFKERLVGYMGQTVSATTPIEINYYEEGHCVVMNPHIGRDFQGSISYVHELQHALRLCGIEKEIVI